MNDEKIADSQESKAKSFSELASELFPSLMDGLFPSQFREFLLDLSVKNPRVFSIIVDAVSLRQHLDAGNKIM